MESPPFRMKTTNAVFKQVVDQISPGLQFRCVTFYMNEIMVYSPSLEKHQRDVDNAFQRLKASLIVSVFKNRLMQDLILVSGQRLLAERIEPNDNKVPTISKLPEPTYVSEIKCFVIMVTIYWSFPLGAPQLGIRYLSSVLMVLNLCGPSIKPNPFKH